MRYLVRQAELLDGLGRLTAADNRDGLRIRQGLGGRSRPLAVRLVLELAQGPIPHDGLRLGDFLLEPLDRLGTNVDAFVAVGDRALDNLRGLWRVDLLHDE